MENPAKTIAQKDTSMAKRLPLTLHKSYQNQDNQDFGPYIVGGILATATIKGSYVPEPTWVGHITLGVVFGLAIIQLVVMLCKGHPPAWRSLGIGFGWLALLAIFTLGMVNGRDFAALYKFTQLSLVFCLFAAAGTLRWNGNAVRRYALTYSLVLLVLWVAISLKWPEYRRILFPANPNGVGIFSFLGIITCIMGFTATNNWNYRLLFLGLLSVFLGTLILSFSRASWLAGCVFVASYILYARFLRYHFFYALWFAAWIMFIALFIFINVSKAREITALEQAITNINDALVDKRMSTREEAWTPCVDTITEHPWMGMGLGWTSQLPGQQDLSAHSNYLQIGVQTGVPGIIAFVLLLYAIGYALTKPSGEIQFGRIGCALLLAMMVHEGFEIVLTDNMLPFGASVWTLLGLCLSLHFRENNHAATKPS